MSEDQTSEVKPPEMPTNDSVNPYVVQPPPQMPPAMTASSLLPAETDPLYVSSDDRTTGMLVHLLALLTGIIGSLIIWLIKKDQSRFVDHHGKEAINFQLTILLTAVALMIVGVITVVGLFIAIPLIWAMGIAAFVMEIMACMAANRGEWHRYPMTIRFIK